MACTSRAWRNVLAAAYPEERVPWRAIYPAYLAGVGINAIIPARALPCALECPRDRLACQAIGHLSSREAQGGEQPAPDEHHDDDARIIALDDDRDRVLPGAPGDLECGERAVERTGRVARAFAPGQILQCNGPFMPLTADYRVLSH